MKLRREELAKKVKLKLIQKREKKETKVISVVRKKIKTQAKKYEILTNSLGLNRNESEV